MALRRRSVRLRVALLVLVPLLFLVSFFAYSVTTSASTVLSLRRARAMMERLGPPITALQQAISQERAQAISYYARPTANSLASLERLQAATDRAHIAFQNAERSSAVQAGVTVPERKAVAALFTQLTRLPSLRARIPTRADGEDQLFTTYNSVITACYQVLEQAILAEGDLSQVLPGIAVVELAISGEYVQQESALLNGDLAAKRFPADDQKAVVSLIGAHRLLYAQSLQYLSQPDRVDLQQDVSPQAAGGLAALENSLTKHASPLRAPPVRTGRWNTAVASYTTGIDRAVAQSQARLAAAARTKADAKLQTLYVTGGIGLAAVALSLAVSLALAANLTRQLAGLRKSALRLADVQLPDVVRRLRAGEEVDVKAEVPPLATGPDEFGQVKAAFNSAQRTAIEAAVDEAKVRRAVNDVFHSLARRSQSLLQRQMALLDGLERRENDPDNLQSLYRIDHLTTRMRRHAESLIVLAGGSPKRAWRKPVPFVDVLRAGAAEVEDYTRIKVTANTKAALAGPAVADVIHLIAELAENATLFSPQNTEVLMNGEVVGNGFVVEIQDRGLGLSDRELQELNDRLADPPAFDLSGSDQLGIFVAAQLAKRHGIQASLRRSPYGGVTAIMLVPQSLVVTPDSDEIEEAASPAAQNGHAVLAGRHALVAERAIAGAESAAAGNPPARGRPVITAAPERPRPLQRPADNGGRRGLFNRPKGAAASGRPGRLPGAADTGAAPRPGPSTSPDAAAPARSGPLPGAADTGAAPRRGPSTSPDAAAPARPGPSARRGDAAGPPQLGSASRPAGAAPSGNPPGRTPPSPPTAGHRLPQRVRQASLAPQLRSEPRPAPSADPESASRDPETARTVMSAFQRGWRRGLDQQAPPADPPN